MSKKIISWDNIRKAHERFKNDLSGESFDYIIAPIRGGLVTGTVMAHVFHEAQLVPVLLQTRDSESQLSISNFDFISSIPSKFAHMFCKNDIKNILITEDIIDTGKTLIILLANLERYNINATIISTIFNKNLTKTIKNTFHFVKDIYYYEELKQDLWYVFPWEQN